MRQRARAAGAWVVLAAAVACRLLLASTVPLTDTTEARFGEMARKMVATGAWLVPQHADGVPYLAKPPLAMWLSALGIEVLGAGELGPRLAILMTTIAFGIAFYRTARVWLDTAAAITALLVLATSLLFFVASAAVMTDMLLTVTVSVALGAFWTALVGNRPQAAWLLFGALGVGLLAKGPLALVLTLAPIAIWTVATGRVGEARRRLPWLRGALVTAAIALPWYIAAELRNPGFLDYFLIGEHLQRFVVPGWDGDLYGRAHDVPRGTILVFFIIGAAPWSLLAVPWIVARRATVRSAWRVRGDLVRFCLLAAAVPLLLFAFAGNVIWPYALPALPPAALALAALVTPVGAACPGPRLWAPAIGTAVAVTAAALLGGDYIGEHSQRAVVLAVEARAPMPLYYWQRRYFSAEYYSAGRASVLTEPASLERALDSGETFALILAEHDRRSLPADLAERLEVVAAVGPMLVLEPLGRKRA